MTSLTALLPSWVHEGGQDKMFERLKSVKERRKIRKSIEEGILDWENMAITNGWENIYVSTVRTSKNRSFEGKNLAEISKEKETDVFTVLFNLLLEEGGK